MARAPCVVQTGQHGYIETLEIFSKHTRIYVFKWCYKSYIRTCLSGNKTRADEQGMSPNGAEQRKDNMWQIIDSVGRRPSDMYRYHCNIMLCIMFKTKCAELVLLKGQPAGQEGGTPNRGGLNQGKGEVYYDIVHSDPQLIRISIGNERSMSANIVHTPARCNQARMVPCRTETARICCGFCAFVGARKQHPNAYASLNIVSHKVAP